MTRHRNDIQGLRAIAVLLVVFEHAGVPFLGGGFVGVDVFFVLSGFLITGLLLSSAAEHSRVRFVNFYVRRARRILPAAALTLAVTQIASYYLVNFVRAKQVIWDSYWASLFVVNIRFAHRGVDYFARELPPSPVLHFWSLAVEEQFYLVWPALLSFVLFQAFRRRSRGHAHALTHSAARRLLVVVGALTVVSLAWSIHYTNVLPAAAYFSTLARVWELALGAILAIVTSGLLRLEGIPGLRPSARIRIAAGWVGLAAIGVAAVTFSSTTPFPGYAAVVPTLGAVLVIGAGIGATHSHVGVGRMLSLRPLRYVGDRSYTFYLWHWPFLVIAAQHEGHRLSLGVNLCLVAGAFLLSIVTYKIFENPIHRADWSARSSILLWPCSVAVVVIVALFTLKAIDAKRVDAELAPTPQPALGGSPQQAGGAGRALPAVVTAVQAARRHAPIPSGLDPPVDQLLHSEYALPSGCGAGDGDTSSNVCHLGRSASSKSVVVFGDSHAQMWMPAILSMAQRDGWAVIPLVKSACTPEKWVLHEGYDECRSWYSWAARQAKALHPDVMLIAGCCGNSLGETADGIKNAFISLAATMQPYSKNVVVIADDYGIPQQPVDCLLAPHATMRTCTPTWKDGQFPLNAALAKAHAFGFIDTVGWFCFQRECPTAVGRTIVYADTDHVTGRYALELASPFRTAFRQTVGHARS
jgi:peptidoglycan/LPS O-acetylase OafA/YrhL